MANGVAVRNTIPICAPASAKAATLFGLVLYSPLCQAFFSAGPPVRQTRYLCFTLCRRLSLSSNTWWSGLWSIHSLWSRIISRLQPGTKTVYPGFLLPAFLPPALWFSRDGLFSQRYSPSRQGNFSPYRHTKNQSSNDRKNSEIRNYKEFFYASWDIPGLTWPCVVR